MSADKNKEEVMSKIVQYHKNHKENNLNSLIEEKENQKKSGFPFAVIWLLFFFFFLSLNILNDRYVLVKVENVYELFLWISMPIVAFMIKDKVYENRQFLIIVLFFGAIWGLGILNPYVRKYNHIMILAGALGLFASFLILAGSLYQQCKRRKEEKHSISNKLFNKKYFPVILIAFVFFLCSIETLTEIPHLDSTLYYSKFNKLSTNFDYSFQNVLTHFCFYKHLSMGYALFALLGEIIQSYTAFGVHLINMILALISGICFYGLLNRIYPNLKNTKKCAAMAAYLLSPFVLGTLGYFNVDLPSIYFYMILLYCLFTNKRILGYFAAYAFIFTKEPCVIYYCFLLLGIWVCSWRVEKEKSIGKFFNSIFSFIRSYFFEILLVVLWLLSYIFLGDTWGGELSVELDVKTKELATFGFTWENCFVKLKQIFVLNFNWLFSLIILISGFIGLIHNKKKRQKETAGNNENAGNNDSASFSNHNENRMNYRICLAFTLIGILFFNFVFLDLLNPRYICLGSVIVLLLGIDDLLKIISEWENGLKIQRWIGSIICCFTVGLVLIQSMVSIDPVSYKVFDPVPYYGKNMFLSGYKLCGITERTIYNREYNYFDRAIEIILDEIDYQEGDLLFFAGHFPNPYGYHPGSAWDPEARRIRTVEKENSVLLDFHRVSIPEDKNPKRIITVLEPDQDAGGKECHFVRYRSMSLKYYVEETD